MKTPRIRLGPKREPQYIPPLPGVIAERLRFVDIEVLYLNLSDAISDAQDFTGNGTERHRELDTLREVLGFIFRGRVSVQVKRRT